MEFLPLGFSLAQPWLLMAFRVNQYMEDPRLGFCAFYVDENK